MNRPTKAFWASLASFVLGGLPLIQPSVFKLSWFRHGLLTPRFRAVALGVCFSLAATVGVAAVPQSAIAAPPAGKVAQPVKSSAPNLVSARVTARVQGSPVEVGAATSTMWANPDGTLTTHAYRGNSTVRPGRTARRHAYAAGAYFGNSWAHRRADR